MKKLSIGLGAVVVLATMAMPSLADVLRGRIKEVDTTKGVVTLIEGKKDYTFAVNGDTKLLNVKGEPLANGLLSGDLKAGRRVTVDYTTTDGASVLNSLQIRP
ncbi:hypothetical protein EON83_22810 [bacterium]|nr:MAG: hypothetical protein EON83_22810 [bacterium]